MGHLCMIKRTILGPRLSACSNEWGSIPGAYCHTHDQNVEGVFVLRSRSQLLVVPPFSMPRSCILLRTLYATTEQI